MTTRAEAFSGAWSVFASLTAAATVIATVKHYGNVDLHGLPLETYTGYSSVRDQIYDAIGMVIPFRLSPIQRDLLSGYLLSGVALFRSLAAIYPGAGSWIEGLVSRMLVVALWPLILVPRLATLTLISVAAYAYFFT